MKSSLPPPSLLRSQVFWAGLVVLACLAWAWRDSTRYWSYLRSGSFVHSSRECGLAVYREPGSRFGWNIIRNPADDASDGEGGLRFGIPGFGRWRELKEAEALELRSQGTLGGRRQDPVLQEFYLFTPTPVGSTLLFIPYWCVMLAMLGLWSGLIYWSYRSIREQRGELAAAREEEGMVDG